MCCFFFHYVSAKFHLWPSSGDFFTVTSDRNTESCNRIPVITVFHSCCLSHHIFDQVNLWPAWVGFETAIFWQCSPGNRRDSTPLSAAPWALKGDHGWIFWSYKSLSGLPESGPYRIFLLVFNWNHFEMRLLNLRINFYLLRTFCPHLGSFCIVSSFTMFWPNFTSGLLHWKKLILKKKSSRHLFSIWLGAILSFASAR